MRPYPKNIRLILSSTLIFIVFAFTAADAYVLQGPHILELMVSRFGKAKRMLVSQKLILFEDDEQQRKIELSETLRFVFPDIFRSDIHSETAYRVHISAKNDSLSAIDGRITHESETEFDRYKDILLYHSREHLHEKLTMLGVNVPVTSLGRFNGKIAYVVGAQYPDESVSQIWIEKETFRPMRWLMTKTTISGEPTILEIQYQNWQLFDGNWYPVQITFIENQRLVREIRVDNVQINPSFTEDLFDIDTLRRNFQPATSIIQDQQGSEDISEVEKLIEDFKKIYQ
jgi:hypothetical protein